MYYIMMCLQLQLPSIYAIHIPADLNLKPVARIIVSYYLFGNRSSRYKLIKKAILPVTILVLALCSLIHAE